jgi:hypothetical protein
MAFDPDKLLKEDKMIMKYSDEVLDLVNHYNELTTSDLQAGVEALVMNLISEIRKELSN